MGCWLYLGGKVYLEAGIMLDSIPAPGTNFLPSIEQN